MLVALLSIVLRSCVSMADSMCAIDTSRAEDMAFV